MPLSTIRHIVKYCHKEPNGHQTLEYVVNRAREGLLRQRDRFQHSTFPVERARLPAYRAKARAVAGRDEGMMFKLPNEMLLMIRDALDEPADAICLALTCKSLFQLLKYKFIDLYKFDDSLVTLDESLSSLQSGYDDLKWARTFLQVAHTQRFLLTDRLDRDWRQKSILEETSRRTGMLACSACVQWHEATCFSEAQKGIPADFRLCILAETKLRMCEHWHISLLDIRANLRQHKTSDARPLHDDYYATCDHASHTTPVSNNGGVLFHPSVQSSSLGYIAHWTLDLRQRPRGYSEDPSTVVSDITARFDLTPSLRRVCDHLPPITDEMVRACVDSSDEVFDQKLFKTRCKVCGLAWAIRSRTRCVGRAEFKRVWEFDTWVLFSHVKTLRDGDWSRFVENQGEAKPEGGFVRLLRPRGLK